MASRWAIGTTFLVILLAACRPPVQTSITERSTGGSKSRGKAAAAAAAAPVPVTLTVTIHGPTPELVSRYGTSASVPGTSGTVPGTGAYALAQAATRFVPVAQAEVTVTDPAGRALAGRGLRTDANGAVKLPKLVSAAPLVFVRATYEVAGRKVFLAAVIPTPRADGALTVDPGTTLIAKKLEMLGRMRLVDLNVVPADMPAKLAAALAPRLSEQEIAAIGLLDPDTASRLLDNRLLTDTALRDALTAAVGSGGPLNAFLQPLPRTAATASASAGASVAPARSARPGEIDAVPTTFPSESVSLAPLTPEPTATPFPVAVSAPPSLAPSPSRSPSPSPSPSPSVAASLAPTPTPSPSVEPSPTASPTPSPTPTPTPST